MDYGNIAPMMGLLWAPLAAVTTSYRGKDNAQIALAIGGASIVPDLPRTVAQIYKHNFSHRQIMESGSFALCFMLKEQIETVKYLGIASGKDEEKLAGIPFERRATGSPVLTDSWGFLDCRVVNAMDGGDMTVFLAEVLDGGILNEGEPLYWSHMRAVVDQEWMERWGRQIQADIELSRRTMHDIRPLAWPPGTGNPAPGEGRPG